MAARHCSFIDSWDCVQRDMLLASGRDVVFLPRKKWETEESIHCGGTRVCFYFGFQFFCFHVTLGGGVITLVMVHTEVELWAGRWKPWWAGPGAVDPLQMSALVAHPAQPGENV